MHLGVRIAALTLGLAAVASPARGQTVEVIRKALDVVSTHRDEMNDAAGRLRPLVLAGTAHEAEPIQTLLVAISALDARADAVLLVGAVLVDMKSPEDFAVAREQFKRAARRTQETANDQLDFIEESLKHIKSPDAAAQASLVRDSVKAIRDAVHPYTARE